ncbi:MAG: tetratricopeptide repeat protein [Bacteroidales bacterium]|nr:tetratricopeptide repeat protein [Bacteroidales bacterium]
MRANRSNNNFYHFGATSWYITLWLLLSINTFSQTTPFDTIEYRKLITTADEAIHNNETEKAIQFLLRASDMLENADIDEELPFVYNKLATLYESLQAYDNAIDYYEKALDYTYSDNETGITEYTENLGDLYSSLNKTQKALDNYLIAFEIQKNKNNGNAIIRISIKLISVYRMMGNYEESVKLAQDALIIAKDMNHKAEFLITNSIGYDQFRQRQYQKAIVTFGDAFEIGKAIGAPKKELINILINQAVCEFNIGKPANAINTLKEGLEKNSTQNDDYLQAKIGNLIAGIYLYLNDLYNAEISSRESIISAKKSGNANMLMECYNTYSKILKAGNDPDGALEYYEKYLTIKDSLSLEERLAENEKSRNQFDLEKLEKEYRLKMAGENLYEMRIKQMETEQARQKEMSQKKIDSLEQARQLANLELVKQRQEVEKERVDRENQNLRYKNDLQEATIKLNEAQEQQRLNEIARLKKEKEQEKKMKHYVVAILVLIGLTAIIILFGLISTIRKKHLLASQKKTIEEKNYHLEQLNEEISTQKEVIEEKNIAITDSIWYAQKIQSAVLPPEDFFLEHLEDYFILFKPRDIVSGDFYWGTHKNDKIVVTAADCTGHGVPGAFMSMLGTAFLNEIVNESALVESDKILNQLRKNVIEALRQTGESGEQSDGMDIALCVIDPKNKILQYSGAYNSMVYISDGELEEIKPDRMPIGIHINAETPFTRQEINYKKGDVFYIFSDGFIDQFGGPEGKKFMNKQFKNFLLSHHQKPMNKQKEELDKVFETWRGFLEQVDDVLVIGVRL